MREILFRGKRTDNGEWVEGDLVQIPYRQWCGIVPQTAHTEVHTIDPETLGQYTGMIDKNGRKIFDGDIVKMGLLCFDGVRYDITKVWYGYHNGTRGFFYGNGRDVLVLSQRRAEVIGNAYDNPELLKGVELK